MDKLSSLKLEDHDQSVMYISIEDYNTTHTIEIYNDPYSSLTSNDEETPEPRTDSSVRKLASAREEAHFQPIEVQNDATTHNIEIYNDPYLSSTSRDDEHLPETGFNSASTNGEVHIHPMNVSWIKTEKDNDTETLESHHDLLARNHSEEDQPDTSDSQVFPIIPVTDAQAMMGDDASWHVIQPVTGARKRRLSNDSAHCTLPVVKRQRQEIRTLDDFSAAFGKISN